MDTFWGLTATDWTAIYTLLTAGLLATAIVAGLYAKRQWTTARDAQVEATRPYVLVTLEPGERSMQEVDFVVRNIGVRPAYNVTISIAPPLLRARESEGHEMASMRLLNEPTSMIPPGQVTRLFYDHMPERAGRKDLSDHHTATVSYADSSGKKWTDTFDLDLRVLEGALFHSYDDIHTLSRTMKKIETTLRKSRVLNKGEMEVLAVTDTRDANEVRTLIEEYQSERERASLMRAVGGGRGWDQEPEENAQKIAERLRALGVNVDDLSEE